ncbi:MAG TPA: DUF3830 family protein [Chloroflexota bacterium]|nr:DUF3830 family protein [Chloroflexota bacterium]
MNRRMRIAFPNRGVHVDVELLARQAPRICEFVWASLPQAGHAHHAVYSGSEIAFIIEPQFVDRLENTTSRVLPGDVGYWFLPGGQMYGQPEDISEFMWFYDRDAEPRMATGPVQVALFGQMIGDTAVFFEACRGMRRTGQELCRVTRLES